MKRRYPYLGSILLFLVAGGIIFYLGGCAAPPSIDIPKKGIAAPVLIPQNVFQEHQMVPLVFKARASREGDYNRKQVFIIDMSSGAGFEWRPEEAVRAGMLRFSAYLPASVRATLDVVRLGEAGEVTVLSRSLSLEDDPIHMGDGYLREDMQIQVDLDPGDGLRFRLTCSHDLPAESKFGISVPRIFKPDRGDFRTVPPNLILISIDTLRADYLGVYRRLCGEPVEFSHSPNIDRLAEEATVFLYAHSPQSSTWPALSSMLLSLYPNQHGVFENGEYLKYDFLSMGGFMLNRGYRTVSMHGNAYNLNLTGFEEKYSFFNRDFSQIRFALKKMRQDGGSLPFFHWYHYLGVHANYTPPRWVMDITARKNIPYRTFNLNQLMKSGETPPPEDIDYIRQLYAGELFHLDFELSKIFTYLKRHALWDNTLIIITSDHGEDLYQHNGYFYHYPSIFETSLRVPLIVKFPRQRRGRVIETPVSLIDIFPTVSHYMNAGESGEALQLAGRSLVPLLEGKTAAFEERVLFSGIDRYRIISTLNGKWKFIFNPKDLQPRTQVGTSYPIGRLGLYDLESDPYESRPITDHPMVRRFINEISRFKKWAADWKADGLRQTRGIGAASRKEAEKNLQTLGYIN